MKMMRYIIGWSLALSLFGGQGLSAQVREVTPGDTVRMTWDVRAGQKMTFGFGGTDGVFVVDWGDGDTNVYTACGDAGRGVEILSAAHTYKKAGEFEVRVYHKPLAPEVSLNMRGYVETHCGDMVMVAVKGGSFVNDSSERVSVKDFYIGAFEVTQAQWKAVMGTNPCWWSRGLGDDYPVYYVSWEEANEFCRKLSQKTGRKYRLPTGAEWEYAARGGQNNDGTKYAGSDMIGDVAWYLGNSNATHPVGLKKPNGLGLYDMSGNVWEWCLEVFYGWLPRCRGGGWSSYDAWDCCVSGMKAERPDARRDYLGFRVVCEP